MTELDVSSVVPLRVARQANLDLERAQEILQAQEISWLGVPSVGHAREGDRRRFRTDLRLPLHAAGREVTFRKAALVDLGPIRRTDGHLRVDI